MATARKRSLADIQAEIERLKKEAEALRKAEVAEVVARIKEAIKHYELTAEDLGLAPPRRGRKPGSKNVVAPAGRRKPGKAKAGKSGVPKYSDGQGRTWTGRGKRPTWFVEAVAAGKRPEDLLITQAAG